MMEADWNKLIERYLQNELSAEGKEAFEYELNTNPGLKVEYDLHLMIMGSAVRSAERAEIAGIGKRFHFRKKWMNAAVIAGIMVLIAVAYLLLNNRETTKEQPNLTENKTNSKTAGPEVANTTDLPIVTAFNTSFIPRLKTNLFTDNSPVVVTSGTSDPGTKSKDETAKTKEEKKQDIAKGKYLVTTIRPSELKVNSSTKEDEPFYLSGNYTWSGDFMVMDTPEGLYLFDTCSNHLFVFKSAYKNRSKGQNHIETIFLGFKHHRNLVDLYQNRKIYKDKDSWYVD